MEATATVMTLQEKLWLRQALRECKEYGLHGEEVEVNEDGETVCLNCGNEVQTQLTI